MLKIKENTVVYVACPGRLKTGGPELLHQLVNKLNSFVVNAVMYYYRPNEKNPVHEAFKIYNNSYTNKIIDNEDNILIVPETKTELLYKYKKIRKAIWWLSIDRFYTRTIEKRRNLLRRLRMKLGLYKLYNFDKEDRFYHLCQSQYAKEHIITKFNDFLNEGIRDVLKPKTDDDINKSFDELWTLSSNNKSIGDMYQKRLDALFKIYKYNLHYLFFFC